ncbi:MAG TPA: hypothetical protein VMU92_09095 [Acidobacteriaceae bacterium]|nr:hypothetical protein [Acidobacteriaceae bacterium]
MHPHYTANPGHKKEPAAQVQAIDLSRGEEAVSNAPPLTVAGFGSKCDVDGDIYLAYSGSAVVMSESGGMNQIPVSRIAPDSMQITKYPVPPRIPDLQGRVARYGFDVSSDGTFYALFNTARRALDGKMIPEWVIAKYNDDGTIDSYINIGRVAGKRIQPLRMAVFGNGDFLLTGTTVLENGLGTFTGLFDQSGDLVRMLALGKPVTDLAHHRSVNPAGKPSQPPSHSKELEAQANNPVSLESSILTVSAADGNVYLLQGTGRATLYVIDSQGEVLRHFNIKPPQPGLSPLQMAQAGAGHLFIYYGYVSTGSPEDKNHPRAMITVLSTTTGDVTAVYRMPKGQTLLLPGCAPSSRKFTFLTTSKDNHLALIPYSVP